jgi:hypothetical protein
VRGRKKKNIHEVKEKPQLAALVYHFVPVVWTFEVFVYMKIPSDTSENWFYWHFFFSSKRIWYAILRYLKVLSHSISAMSWYMTLLSI